MCKEDYNWKKHGSQRIREYTDRDLTDVKERFSRSPHLVSYFSGRLKNAWKLQNQVKELDMGVYYSLKSGKSQLRTVFTNEILSEKTRMSCSKYFPSNTMNNVKSACELKCSANSLEENIHEDDLSLDYYE
eukprot:gene9403-1611_t